MTVTTRSTACRAAGATLRLACELGSTTWVLGFTTARAERPPVRTMTAGDLRVLEKESRVAKMRCGRSRRAKTDRLDVAKLLALLVRWLEGERRVWRVVHVPSPDAEAQRQLTREIATVGEDWKRVCIRIQALLATQGIRLELNPQFVAHLALAQTGAGPALPPSPNRAATR